MKVMKNINDYISETMHTDVWDDINIILKKTGWPQLEEENDKMVSWDEDTKITFELDKDNGLPFISKIECNFVNMNPTNKRDLNGLVDLYDKLWTDFCKKYK